MIKIIRIIIIILIIMIIILMIRIIIILLIILIIRLILIIIIKIIIVIIILGWASPSGAFSKSSCVVGALRAPGGLGPVCPGRGCETKRGLRRKLAPLTREYPVSVPQGGGCLMVRGGIPSLVELQRRWGHVFNTAI
jgi:hypothetical protein